VFVFDLAGEFVVEVVCYWRYLTYGAGEGFDGGVGDVAFFDEGGYLLEGDIRVVQGDFELHGVGDLRCG